MIILGVWSYLLQKWSTNMLSIKYFYFQLLRAGWWGEYSFRCEPVDYSDSYNANLMVWFSWIYYISKFSEFIDTVSKKKFYVESLLCPIVYQGKSQVTNDTFTKLRFQFCFVLRKKFNHISLLHVVHHGILPISVWPGARWVPGGHSTFFGLLNTFVHFFMYFYYMVAAMGPQYQKYIWWKRHMTNMQMMQFIGIFIHGTQLLIRNDCNYPTAFGYFIAGHAVLFFVLFSQFYIKEYYTAKSKTGKKVSTCFYKIFQRFPWAVVIFIITSPY